MPTGLTPNLAGLLVVLVGVVVYRLFARKRIFPPVESVRARDGEIGAVVARIKTDALRRTSRLMRFIGVTLLVAIIAATGVALFRLTEPIESIRISIPDTKIPVAAADTYLLTALLVRENDGHVIRAWEKTTAPGESLVFSTPAMEYQGDIRISVEHQVQEAYPEFAVTTPGYTRDTQRTFTGNIPALNDNMAHIPKLKFSDSEVESGNFFSLITRGGACHLLCFATPVKRGVPLPTVDADTIVGRMNWLRAPIRKGSWEEFDIVEDRIPKAERWKASHSLDSTRGIKSCVSSFTEHLGVTVFILILSIPALLWTGTRFAPVKFVCSLCLMLGFALLAEHAALRVAKDKGSVHRLFTAANFPR